MFGFFKCLNSPRLYRLHRSSNGRAAEYQANDLESYADAAVKWFRFFKSFTYYTSPVIFVFLYRRGTLHSVEGWSWLIKFTTAVVLLHVTSCCFRAIGRCTNSEYMTFMNLLESAKKNWNADTRRKLSSYDFEFFAWPTDFDVTQFSEQKGRSKQVVEHRRSREGPMWKLVPCKFLGYLAINTFGRRMIYPGATALQYLMAPALNQGRAKLVEEVHDPKDVNEDPLPSNGPLQPLDWSTFRLGVHQCGKLYEVTELGFMIVIKEINLKQHTAVCWPVMGEAVDKDMTVTLKLSRLMEVNMAVKGNLKKEMREITTSAFSRTAENMKEGEFRKELRRSQLASAVKREVSAAFRARSRRKNFDLGIITLDVDCALFELVLPDRCSLEVSYKKGNLSFLDKLLGSSWDIESKDGRTQYVTCLRLKVTSQLILTGAVRVADYDSMLPVESDYRKVFSEHMAVH